MKRVQLFFDRMLNYIFNGGAYEICNIYKNGQSIEERYGRFPSICIGVVHSICTVQIGNYSTIVYMFNEKGKITSRKLLRQIFKEKGKLIIGNSEVQNAYKENQWKTSILNDGFKGTTDFV